MDPREGIFEGFFDHFIVTCKPGWAKIMSPLARWYKGENCLKVCGTKLEILKKEKKARVYTALKT